MGSISITIGLILIACVRRIKAGVGHYVVRSLSQGDIRKVRRPGVKMSGEYSVRQGNRTVILLFVWADLICTQRKRYDPPLSRLVPL